MSYATHFCSSPADLAGRSDREIGDLLSRSLAKWATAGSSQELAAEWYQASQNLCRKGIPIDEVLQFIERATEDVPRCKSGPRKWVQFRNFVKYYTVRGYQDAIR